MPSKSKAQQRFFGKDFAETKHKGLLEKVDENIIRLTESDLHRIVMETVDKILNDEAQDHTYSEKEMKWLYDNQGELSPIEQKVLNAGMWVRARKANYHGYVKEWPNIAVINGEIFYYENGKLEKIPSWK